MRGVIGDAPRGCAEGNPVSPPGVVAKRGYDAIWARTRKCSDLALVTLLRRHGAERAWEGFDGRCCDLGCIGRMTMHIHEMRKDLGWWQHMHYGPVFCSPVRFLGRGDRGIDTARRAGTTLTVTTLREIGRLILYSMYLDRHEDERVTNDPQPRDYSRWSLGYRISCCEWAASVAVERQQLTLGSLLTFQPTNQPNLSYHMLPLLCSRSFKYQYHSLNIVSRHYRPFYLSGPRNMHRKVTIDTSPPPARWMKDNLVRSAFHRTVPVVAARLPAAKAGSVLKAEPMRG